MDKRTRQGKMPSQNQDEVLQKIVAKAPLKTHTEVLKIQIFSQGRPPKSPRERGDNPHLVLPSRVPSACYGFLRQTTFKWTTAAVGSKLLGSLMALLKEFFEKGNFADSKMLQKACKITQHAKGWNKDALFRIILSFLVGRQIWYVVNSFIQVCSLYVQAFARVFRPEFFLLVYQSFSELFFLKYFFFNISRNC